MRLEDLERDPSSALNLLHKRASSIPAHALTCSPRLYLSEPSSTGNSLSSIPRDADGKSAAIQSHLRRSWSIAANTSKAFRLTPKSASWDHTSSSRKRCDSSRPVCSTLSRICLGIRRLSSVAMEGTSCSGSPSLFCSRFNALSETLPGCLRCRRLFSSGFLLDRLGGRSCLKGFWGTFRVSCPTLCFRACEVFRFTNIGDSFR
jgi:hypothetical protein